MAFKRTFRICVWTVLGIVCVAFLVYNIYNRITYYLSYPTKSSVRIDRRIEAAFPGFTYCASTKDPFHCKYMSGGGTDLGSCAEYGQRVTQVGGREGICGQFKEKIVMTKRSPTLLIQYNNKTTKTPPAEAIIQFHSATSRRTHAYKIDFKSTNGLLLSKFEEYRQLQNCDPRNPHRNECEIRARQASCGANKIPCNDQSDFTQYYPIDFKDCVDGGQGKFLRQCWDKKSVQDRCGASMMDACDRKEFMVSEVVKASIMPPNSLAKTWTFAVAMEQNQVIKVYQQYYAEDWLSVFNSIGTAFAWVLFVFLVLWLLMEVLLLLIVKLCLKTEEKSLEQRVQQLESMMQEGERK